MFPASFKKQYFSRNFHIFGRIQSGIPCHASYWTFWNSTIGLDSYSAYELISSSSDFLIDKSGIFYLKISTIVAFTYGVEGSYFRKRFLSMPERVLEFYKDIIFLFFKCQTLQTNFINKFINLLLYKLLIIQRYIFFDRIKDFQKQNICQSL